MFKTLTQFTPYKKKQNLRNLYKELLRYNVFPFIMAPIENATDNLPRLDFAGLIPIEIYTGEYSVHIVL